MKITAMKLKFLGTVGYVYRVFNAAGELVGVYDTQEAAQEFVNAQ
jgi:hypothetical protein